MRETSRQKVIAGNWKMHKSIHESIEFVHQLAPMVKHAPAQVFLAVPFTVLKSVADAAIGTNLVVGVQNVHDQDHGAYTGEISARMAKDAGAQFTIVGHSERRRLFNESNSFVNAKAKRALNSGLKVIVCVGETIEARMARQTEEVLQHDLQESLAGISAEQMKDVIIAYEPIWAIGTQQPATPGLAQEAMQFCRELIFKKWGQEIAGNIILQYGGSVSAENAKLYLEQKDIDGLLVGGASLSVDTFSKIVNPQNILNLT